jgi:hypothetical protein
VRRLITLTHSREEEIPETFSPFTNAAAGQVSCDPRRFEQKTRVTQVAVHFRPSHLTLVGPVEINILYFISRNTPLLLISRAQLMKEKPALSAARYGSRRSLPSSQINL